MNNKQYAFIKNNGEVASTVSPSGKHEYGHCVTIGQYLCVEIPNTMYQASLFDLWYFKNVWRERPIRPSDWHAWDLDLELWIVNIEDLKAKASKEISASCSSDIFAGYSSVALGSSHHYPCNQQDQANMVASVTDSLNPLNDETWQTPFWCADTGLVWAYRMHTAAQIQKAGSDGKAHITACLFKNAGLQAQIAAATTKEELDAIIW